MTDSEHHRAMRALFDKRLGDFGRDYPDITSDADLACLMQGDVFRFLQWQEDRQKLLTVKAELDFGSLHGSEVAQ